MQYTKPYLWSTVEAHSTSLMKRGVAVQSFNFNFKLLLQFFDIGILFLARLK